MLILFSRKHGPAALPGVLRTHRLDTGLNADPLPLIKKDNLIPNSLEAVEEGI